MLTFLFKNLLIFTQNFSLSNVEKKFFLSSLFLKKIYQFFKIWKKFMHKNAIKIVGGVKFSKKIPQNVGFFVQKLWDFQHWGGDKIVGFSALRGGFSPFNFWPHWSITMITICMHFVSESFLMEAKIIKKTSRILMCTLNLCKPFHQANKHCRNVNLLCYIGIS